MPKKYKIVTFILFFLKRNSNYCVSFFILLVSTAKTKTLTLRWKRNNELKCTYLFPTDYKNIWSNGEVKKIKILCHILPFLFWILDNINRIWGQIKKKKEIEIFTIPNSLKVLILEVVILLKFATRLAPRIEILVGDKTKTQINHFIFKPSVL